MEITLNIHWKDWGWRWISNTLVTWCKESTHWKRAWCWEILKAKENSSRGSGGWMASVHGMSNSMDMNLSKLQNIVKEGEAWCAAVHRVTKNQIQFSDWTAIYFCTTCFSITKSCPSRWKQFLWTPFFTLLEGKMEEEAVCGAHLGKLNFGQVRNEST